MNLFGFSPVAMTQFWSAFSAFLVENGMKPKAEFYIPLAMTLLRQSNSARMRVLKTDSDWFGVTYQQDRPEVMRKVGALVADGTYPAPLWG